MGGSTEDKAKKKSILLLIAACTAFFTLYLLWIYAPASYSIECWTEKGVQYAIRFTNVAEYLRTEDVITKFGFSSFTARETAFAEAGKITHYLVGIETYLPIAIIDKFFGWEAFKAINPLLDLGNILICGICWSILIEKYFLRRITGNTTKQVFLVRFLAFTIYSTAPWTIQMSTQVWSLSYFVTWISLATLSWLENKKILAYIFLSFSLVIDYVSPALFAVYCISICIASKLDKLSIEKIPPFMLTKDKRLNKICTLACFIPLVAGSIRMTLAKTYINGLETFNSSIALRTGIGESFDTSGILGAYRFLNGTAYRGCREGVICHYLNWSTALISVFAISMSWLIFKNINNRNHQWILYPFYFFSLALPLVIQQTYFVHPYGYGYFFVPIYALGITYAIVKLFKSKYYKEYGPIICAFGWAAPVISVTGTNISWLTYLAEKWGC